MKFSSDKTSSKRKKLFETDDKMNTNHPFRRLIIFQLKLAVDALRDILLSPVSIICSLMDLAEKKKGENSYFEKLMMFGRSSEERINLFEQYRQDKATIDSILNQVEGVVMKEYKDKKMTAKTMAAIKKTLGADQSK